MNHRTYISCMMLLFFLCSCSMQGNKNNAQEETQKDSMQNDNQSAVLNVTDLTDIKKSQMFAYSVYERISKENKGNMVCSPFGIEILYSILREGAKWNTYNELNNVLGISHAEASSMAKDMELPSDTISTTIDMANLIVVNKKYSLNHSFATSARQNYGAEIWSRPFSNSTLEDINRWIGKKTNGMIDKGLSGFDASAVMYGINTLYFNGKWQNPFDETKTKPTVFTDVTGKKSKVMMMSQRSHFRYMKTKSFQVLAMPYKQRIAKDAKMKNLSLYVFLPLPRKDFSSITDYLKSKSIKEMKDEMSYYARQHYDDVHPIVNVKFPRMEVSSKTDVMSVMKNLGVKTAFEENADFRNISGNDLCISESQQKSVIRIDEKGTEAAAMTAVELNVLSIEESPKEAFFYANRPFVYMIICEDTNTILFIGQYTAGMMKNDSGVWVSDRDIKDAAVLSYRKDEAEDVPVQQMNNDRNAEDHVYDVVENMPSYPGGISQMRAFIQNNLRYPEDAIKDGIQGRVILSFIVEKDGSLTDIKVVRSVSPSLDKEAIRIVKSMPKWIPGKQNGRSVRVKYIIPINFKKNM